MNFSRKGGGIMRVKQNAGHGRAYHQHYTKVHIHRKAEILRYFMLGPDDLCRELKEPHRLNKGKVHCSCPLCTEKTRNLGWKHSDKKRIQAMKDEIKEKMTYE